MSLRARLIAVLLAVAAAGLLLLAGITYALLRSYELQRTDDQARSAIPLMERILDGNELGPGPGPRFGGGPPPERTLPPGTYAERRDAGGAVTARRQITLGGPALSPPELPADLDPGATVTVPAESGELRYRAVAGRGRAPGETIVAAVPLAEVDRTLDRLLLVEALVIAGVLLVLGVAAAWLVRLGLRPLDRMGTTAGIIAGGELSRRVAPATPRTEVGRLGLALNAMLDRLEEAFAQRQASEDRLRRFLSDASHELRTPLASIRGYAELFRMGAASDRRDVEKAMRRIEEEAARMGVLVEDLLALARLDEEREPVRSPVDVARIARDATDDARATASDRRIDLDAPAGADVLADPHQLRQVLANLLRNAIVHTPAGTPIAVSVARAADRVTIAVRDHGPGLPDGDPDALFERFWRAEGGRERGRAGAGLGLAIVAGIVAAHHGTVKAENAPGGGARFTVTLPATPQPAPSDVAPSHPSLWT
jgi:two-component system OmpR family sensor kinase